MDSLKAQKKKRDVKHQHMQSIYSRCLLTKKVVLPITVIGDNLFEVLTQYIHNHFEGKCVAEGFIKSGSTKIIRHSSGVIERGSNIVFEIIFECYICFPVEGLIVSCIVKNSVKAGIRAESATDDPSPIVVFLAKDHHYNSKDFNDVQIGDTINVRVIGQRFELNDKAISIIGELIKEKEKEQPTKKPRLIIN
jgi:DNA-directed RNA polymerase subunit E'/Rpb7